MLNQDIQNHIVREINSNMRCIEIKKDCYTETGEFG